jgi:hypothetical protein
MEIKDRSTAFQGKSFVFEGRSSNFEAHNLARFSISLDIGPHLWHDNPYSMKIRVNIIVNQ